MNGMIKADSFAPTAWGDVVEPPVAIVRPARLATPFVFASPHSGRVYPPDFLAASQLDPLALRASEDAYVDELFAIAPRLGAPLVAARFPRAYVDPNREPGELDPGMFDGPLPAWVNARSPRVAAGLGAIPRIVADGAEIYGAPVEVGDALRRIAHLHRPYHEAIKHLLDEAQGTFGQAVLIDCHSMPSVGGPGDRDRGRGRVDVVLGDRYGSSCAPGLTRFLERELVRRGYQVARNAPYAGGWSTERYGKPAQGLHAVQVEINRGLYLDEARVVLTEGFERLKTHIAEIVRALINAEPSALLR